MKHILFKFKRVSLVPSLLDDEEHIKEILFVSEATKVAKLESKSRNSQVCTTRCYWICSIRRESYKYYTHGTINNIAMCDIILMQFKYRL